MQRNPTKKKTTPPTPPPHPPSGTGLELGGGYRLRQLGVNEVIKITYDSVCLGRVHINLVIFFNVAGPVCQLAVVLLLGSTEFEGYKVLRLTLAQPVGKQHYLSLFALLADKCHVHLTHRWSRIYTSMRGRRDVFPRHSTYVESNVCQSSVTYETTYFCSLDCSTGHLFRATAVYNLNTGQFHATSSSFFFLGTSVGCTNT